MSNASPVAGTDFVFTVYFTVMGYKVAGELEGE
jgi:hypothetical protein